MTRFPVTVADGQAQRRPQRRCEPGVGTRIHRSVVDIDAQRPDEPPVRRCSPAWSRSWSCSPVRRLEEPRLAKPCPVGSSRSSCPGCGVWWGAFVSPDRGADDVSAAPLLKLEHQVGRRLAIVHRYHDMSPGPRGLFPDATERAIGTDRLLFIGWASRVYGGVDYTWRDIADGEIDATRDRPGGAPGRGVRSTALHRLRPRAGDPSQRRLGGRLRRRLPPHPDRFNALGAKNAVWVWTVTGFKAPLGPVRRLVSRATTPSTGSPGTRTTSGSVTRAGDLVAVETIKPFYDWLVDHHPTQAVHAGRVRHGGRPERSRAAAHWYGELVPR